MKRGSAVVREGRGRIRWLGMLMFGAFLAAYPLSLIVAPPHLE
jgi:hypothetical protein